MVADTLQLFPSSLTPIWVFSLNTVMKRVLRWFQEMLAADNMRRFQVFLILTGN